MFAQQTAPPSNFFGFTAFSVVIHVALVAALLYWANPQDRVQKKEVELTFMKAMAPPAPLPPPPPPPPPAMRKTTPKVTPKPKEMVVPKEIKPIEPPKEEKPPEPEPEPEPAPAERGQETGVAGGVVGGVEGGTVGGVVGGTVAGGGAVEQVKPKNVPPFVIQRDVVRQVPPRLSEVFKQMHRNSGTITGMYRICVGTDGKVFDVIPVKAVPGADSDIISGIKEGWEYKPQKVPVCFLYNIPITIQ